MPAEITNQDLFEAITDFAVHVEEKFEIFDQRFDQIELKISGLEIQVRTMSYEMREMNARIEGIDGRLTAVENDVKDIFYYLAAPSPTS